MKTLIASLILVSGVAQAASISSIEECTIALYKSNPWKNSYSVENSRITGKKASALVETLKAEGAKIETHVDILGVSRYNTIVKRKVLQTEGTEINSCEGVSFALKYDICTVDAAKQTCETFCKFEWVGEDCR